MYIISIATGLISKIDYQNMKSRMLLEYSYF